MTADGRCPPGGPIKKSSEMSVGSFKGHVGFETIAIPFSVAMASCTRSNPSAAAKTRLSISDPGSSSGADEPDVAAEGLRHIPTPRTSGATPTSSPAAVAA